MPYVNPVRSARMGRGPGTKFSPEHHKTPSSDSAIRIVSRSWRNMCVGGVIIGHRNGPALGYSTLLFLERPDGLAFELRAFPGWSGSRPEGGMM